jgi:DNA-binding transcriptional MerR regulator
MSDTSATTATTVPASAAPTTETKTAPITPAEAAAQSAARQAAASIPAGHKLVSEADYAKYTDAATKVGQWGAAIDAMSQQGFSPQEIADILTTPAQAPAKSAPAAQSQAPDVEAMIEKRFAARDHTEALTREADSLTTTVTDVIGKGQPEVLQEMVAALAKQHADTLRGIYPANHPLRGQRAPLTREQVAAVKTFAADKFKSLSGSLAKQVGRVPSPGVAGNFAPSGAPTQANQTGPNGPNPFKFSAQEKEALGNHYLEAARARHGG